MFNNFYILHGPKIFSFTSVNTDEIQCAPELLLFLPSLKWIISHESAITGNAEGIFEISVGIERQGQGDLETTRLDSSFEFCYKCTVFRGGCGVKAMFS